MLLPRSHLHTNRRYRSPALGLHARNDTESSYSNLRLGAGNGFERGISDMITAV